jgi:hypothetical protein
VSPPTVTIQDAVSGGTTSTGWTATLDSLGSVSSILGGTEGNYRPTISFAGTGSGATATCSLNANGGIVSVTVTASGSGYTFGTTISIQGKVSSVVAADLLIHSGDEQTRCATWGGETLAGKWVTREVASGGNALSSLEVVYGGRFMPKLVISGGGGFGARASVTGISSAGVITSIELDDPGEGYTSAPTVTALFAGGQSSASPASITASLDTSSTRGELLMVTLASGGEYRPPVTITGGGGTGATATANLAVDGSVSSLNLTSGGSGFISAPQVLVLNGVGDYFCVAHFGTETEYADGTQPPSALPLGYIDGQIKTYPIIGDPANGEAPYHYFSLPLYNEAGEFMDEGYWYPTNYRAFYDCSACP